MKNQDSTQDSLLPTRITLRQIAQSLNISHTTVSRVLNNTEGVFISEATRMRVVEEAARLGYQPNHAARALITGKTNIVGLAIGEFGHRYNVQAMHAVDSYLSKHKKKMMVQRLPALGNTNTLFAWPLDGLIVLDFPDHVFEIVQNAPPGLPIVSMGAYSADLTDHVTLDLFSGAIEAVEWLARQQCTRILFVTTQWDARVGEPRRDAYYEVMQHAKMAPENVITPSLSRQDAHQTFGEYLQQGHLSKEDKVGLFCINDEVAIGCYRALRENYFDLQKKVFIAGCDNTENLLYIDPRIGSIGYDFEAVCKSAVSMMMNRIKNPKISRQEERVGSYLRRGVFEIT
jgi:LacI family transcriptional regulator